MIDVSSNEAREFIAGVGENLSRLKPKLIPELRRIITTPVAPEMFLLSFEADVQSLTNSFPITGYPMSADCSQIDWAEFGMAFSLLEEEATYPFELTEIFPEEDFYEAAALSMSVLIPWFANAWLEAGGADFPIPATISQHDADEEIHLQTGRVQPANSMYR